MLRICGISVTGLLAGASVTVASLSIPIASFVLAGVSIASITFTESMIEGFTRDTLDRNVIILRAM